jgi:hypothetical protein
MNFSGKSGIYPLVQFTACLRRLTYGDSADWDDENLEIAESTVNASLKNFTKLMKDESGGGQYLNRCLMLDEIEE